VLNIVFTIEEETIIEREDIERIIEEDIERE